jgi:Leucine-rich repeat (LRR) protein
VKVSGDHLARMNYNHVTALEIRGQTCNFLPQRIKNFFPNLELLRVVNSQLKIISQSDLKPLTKLRVVQMSGNHLTSLNNDLFEANQNLVRVDFRSQKLKLIGYNIFDKSDKLALADFQNGGCVNFLAENGKIGVEELKKEISEMKI